MLFLVAIGAGAAVLEVHRALHNNGNGDVKELREKEASLRKQLQDMQRDLRTAQQQRQLTEAEASQLAAVNQRLSAENADLAATSSSLKAENEALAARADSLLERQAALESAAESLKLENCTLLQQFDRLKIKYEHEAAGFQEQVAELKAAVSGALSRFTSGEISADQLTAFLSAMGVELRCRKEALDSLPDQLNSARSFDERLKLLDQVQVECPRGSGVRPSCQAAHPSQGPRRGLPAASRQGAAAEAGRRGRRRRRRQQHRGGREHRGQCGRGGGCPDGGQGCQQGEEERHLAVPAREEGGEEAGGTAPGPAAGGGPAAELPGGGLGHAPTAL